MTAAAPTLLRRSLRRSRDGIAAVEFAFVAPVFILMTTAAIDLGYIQLVRAELQGATQVAARKVIQSNSGTSAERATVVSGTIDEMMSGFGQGDDQDTVVSVASFASFAKLAPEPFTDANRNGTRDSGEAFTDVNGNAAWDRDLRSGTTYGDVGKVVKIDVSYPFKPLFSYNAALFGVDGEFTVDASAIFRNEPE